MESLPHLTTNKYNNTFTKIIHGGWTALLSYLIIYLEQQITIIH